MSGEGVQRREAAGSRLGVPAMASGEGKCESSAARVTDGENTTQREQERSRLGLGWRDNALDHVIWREAGTAGWVPAWE